MTQRSTIGSGEFNTTQSNQGTTGAAMSDAANQAKETAGQVADQTKQAARRVVDQAREQASSTLGTQKESAAAGLSSVAQALRQTGQQLRDQDQVGITSYIDSAASQVEDISSYLQNSDLSQLVDDVERFARRRPALFLGGAFALGLLGARFLKSSRQQVTGSGNYPMVRSDMYSNRPEVYGRDYQQSFGPETAPYGTASGSWPTTTAEDQL